MQRAGHAASAGHARPRTSPAFAYGHVHEDEEEDALSSTKMSRRTRTELPAPRVHCALLGRWDDGTSAVPPSHRLTCVEITSHGTPPRSRAGARGAHWHARSFMWHTWA